MPKNNGDKRPLGVLTLEDKMVQMALAKIIGAVYKQVFLDCSMDSDRTGVAMTHSGR